MSRGRPERNVEAVASPGGAEVLALQVDRLSVTKPRGEQRVPITDGVDLRVRPGEAVAVVGESGSGKSITARAILDLLPHGLAAEGAVAVQGLPVTGLSRAQARRVRGTEVALVMQDPFTILNPVQRVGVQITATLRTTTGRRLRRTERLQEAIRRLEEVGITDPAVADAYPFELSGGMRQRVAIAAAIAERPRVLIADEATTALDVTTQREILDLLDRLRRSHRLGLVLITHDLRVAFSVCDRVHVMYAGEVVEVGDSAGLATRPAHPYTANLLLADPPLDRRVDELAQIPGAVPAPGHRPEGCRFAPRCRWATAVCTGAPPQLRSGAGPDRQVRCHRYEQIAAELLAPGRVEASETTRASSSTGPVLIETDDVVRRFGPKVALDGATIRVRAGESVALVGESGSGKTTLARLVMGLTGQSSGSVRVGGVELGASMTRADWETVRSTVQMAFQDPYSTLNPHRSVGATLRDALRLVSPRDLDARTEAMLEQVGLPAQYASRMPGQLSGGERQRVAIARALAREPKILVCDEVVSALDVSVQAHILNLLRRLQRELGLGYVFITHDLAVVRQIADRVYVMHQGRIVEEGPTHEVLDNPRATYTRRLISSVPRSIERRPEETP